MTSISNNIDDIDKKTSKFQFYETNKYFKKQFSLWNRDIFEEINKSKINETISNIKQYNIINLKTFKNDLTDNANYLKKCYKTNESKITKIQIINEIKSTFFQLKILENLNNKSSHTNPNTKTIMDKTRKILEKMTKNIIDYTDITSEPLNDFLCAFRKKINETNSIDPKILNNLLIQTNFTNLNPLEEKELKTVNENSNDEIVLGIIERFNDTNDETNWEKFKNNHKYRFTKEGNYIEVPSEEPSRFKETINILRNWIDTKLDLYHELLKDYFNNKEIYKQLMGFKDDLMTIIYELQNIKAKINGILTDNVKKYIKPAHTMPNINEAVIEQKNKEKHEKCQKEQKLSNFKNVLNKNISEDLIKKEISFQEKQIAKLKIEILEVKNEKISNPKKTKNQKINNIQSKKNLRAKKQKILNPMNIKKRKPRIKNKKVEQLTAKINEFKQNLEKTDSIPKINNLLLNISKEINGFIQSNGINQEQLQKEINKIIKEFNVKIHVLPEKNLESYTDIVNQFNEELSKIKKLLKPSDIYYKKINELIDETKNKLKQNNNLENALISIVNTTDKIFNNPLSYFIDELKQFLLKIKEQNKPTNTISNIKNNLKYVLEDLVKSKEFIFKKHKQINLTDHVLSASFCNQTQDLLAYKCNILVPTTTNTTQNWQIFNTENYKDNSRLDRIGSGEILGLNQEPSSNFPWFLPAVGIIGVGLVAVGIKQFWNNNSAKECNTLDEENQEQQSELIPKTLV